MRGRSSTSATYSVTGGTALNSYTSSSTLAAGKSADFNDAASSISLGNTTSTIAPHVSLATHINDATPSPQVRMWLAISALFRQLGETTEAGQALAEATALAPLCPLVSVEAAAQAAAAGHIDQAMAHHRRALCLDVNCRLALCSFSEFLLSIVRVGCFRRCPCLLIGVFLTEQSRKG